MFDVERCAKQGFQMTMHGHGRNLHVSGVRLEGIGPKLLVSDVTTHDVPLLRWRLELKGNNAVEFGTIPVSLQVRSQAPHANAEATHASA